MWFWPGDHPGDSGQLAHVKTQVEHGAEEWSRRTGATVAFAFIFGAVAMVIAFILTMRMG